MSKKLNKKPEENKTLPAKIPHIESTPLRWFKKEEDNKLSVTVGRGSEEVGNCDDLFSKRCMEIAGVKDPELASSILFEAARAIEPLIGVEQARNVIAQSLHDFQPRDAIEARLATQAAVIQTYAMKSMKRSGDADMLCHIEAMANLGIKLMRVYNETVDALARYRRGGIQQVIVQHQNNIMTDKAVVNNITGVGVPPPNQGDTPCQQSAEQKPEPINISHVGNQQ